MLAELPLHRTVQFLAAEGFTDRQIVEKTGWGIQHIRRCLNDLGLSKVNPNTYFLRLTPCLPWYRLQAMQNMADGLLGSLPADTVVSVEKALKNAIITGRLDEPPVKRGSSVNWQRLVALRYALDQPFSIPKAERSGQETQYFKNRRRLMMQCMAWGLNYRQTSWLYGSTTQGVERFCGRYIKCAHSKISAALTYAGQEMGDEERAWLQAIKLDIYHRVRSTLTPEQYLRALIDPKNHNRNLRGALGVTPGCMRFTRTSICRRAEIPPYRVLLGTIFFLQQG